MKVRPGHNGGDRRVARGGCPRTHGCVHTDSEFCSYLRENITRIVALEPNALEEISRHFNRNTRCRVLEEVESLAMSLLQKGVVEGPPVPTALIELIDLRHLVHIQYVPVTKFGGALWFLGNRWVIQLSSMEGQRDNRFNLFHEAFHILTRVTDEPPRGHLPRKDPMEEFMADLFSLFVLMPRHWVARTWADVQDVRAMAELFGVPTLGAKTRLIQLGILGRRLNVRCGSQPPAHALMPAAGH